MLSHFCCVSLWTGSSFSPPGPLYLSLLGRQICPVWFHYVSLLVVYCRGWRLLWFVHQSHSCRLGCDQSRNLCRYTTTNSEVVWFLRRFLRSFWPMFVLFYVVTSALLGMISFLLVRDCAGLQIQVVLCCFSSASIWCAFLWPSLMSLYPSLRTTVSDQYDNWSVALTLDCAGDFCAEAISYLGVFLNDRQCQGICCSDYHTLVEASHFDLYHNDPVRHSHWSEACNRKVFSHYNYNSDCAPCPLPERYTVNVASPPMVVVKSSVSLPVMRVSCTTIVSLWHYSLSSHLPGVVSYCWVSISCSWSLHISLLVVLLSCHFEYALLTFPGLL